MRKIYLLFLLLNMLLLKVTAQTNLPEYGNNPSAGHFQALRGIKMYYEIYGSGQPLLLIHGNGGRIASMGPIIPYFSSNYKVIVTDSRAHGKSVDQADSLSFEMMADDEAALLDLLQLDLPS